MSGLPIKLSQVAFQIQRVIGEVTHVKKLGVFQKTEEKTALWIEDVAQSMGSTDMERSYHVLRSVLHAVRDRLPPDEAVHLGAQMPMLVRGFYYEGWHPADKPERYRHKKELLDHVATDVPSLDRVQQELAVTAVFGVLQRKIGPGETEQVKQALPAEIRELWESSERD
jgi:uncharacterized protein (DUF2267 family)